MPYKQNLYFIAIIPPQEICEAITAIKQDFAGRFESKTALKVIPHITLKAPFKLSAADHESVLKWFNKMQITTPPFQQELKDFGAFNNKRNPVIFVQPVMNPALKGLQKEIVQHFKTAYPGQVVSGQELEFSPHITVAYRDLKTHHFHDAWQEYQSKKYKATFTVTRFHLLQHDGSRWNTVGTLVLQ